MRRGELGPQHGGPEAKVKRAGRPRRAAATTSASRSHLRATRRCPTGAPGWPRCWSGDMVTAIICYLPKGTKPASVLSYWYADATAGRSSTTSISVGAEGGQAGDGAPLPQLPARRRRRLRQLRRATSATSRRSPRSTRRRCPTTASSRTPLRGAVVTREAYANGNAYLALTAAGDQLWDGTWQAVQERLTVRARSGPARAPGRRRGSPCSSASRSTRSSASGFGNTTRSTSRCRTGTRWTGTSATCSRALDDVAPGGRVLGRLRAHDSSTSRSRSRSRWRSATPSPGTPPGTPAAGARRCSSRSSCRSGSPT